MTKVVYFTCPQNTRPDIGYLGYKVEFEVIRHMRVRCLRHTHATLMLKGSVHSKVVQEHLGHANIGITLGLYSHVLPRLQEAAAEHFDKMLEQDVGKMLAIDEN